MEQLQLPNTYKFISEEGNRSVFEFSPCYPGYGVTIGNAIRRILLSSLPGAAATAVKIKGIDHEFSTIDNVKEDVVEIILNLKQLCLKSHSKEPVRITLKARGDKEVKASMFEKNDLVEIINPDLHLATLDGKAADFEMEIIVEQGRGYVPVEAREDEKHEIGMIAIDAIYTPVRNVNFSVENVRVGKMTNYDKLTLDITTNGTISGREALDQSAQIAVDHFRLLLRENFENNHKITQVEPGSLEEEPAQISETDEAGEKKSPEPDEQPANEILSLSLSKRSYNALNKNGIATLKQLKALTREDLNSFRGLGEKSIEEIIKVISEL